MSDRIPVFLERRVYRRRRVVDASRLLPVLAIALFLMPMLWANEGQGARTSTGGLYLVGVWALLILTALGLGRALSRMPSEEEGRRSERKGH